MLGLLAMKRATFPILCIPRYAEPTSGATIKFNVVPCIYVLWSAVFTGTGAFFVDCRMCGAVPPVMQYSSVLVL